MITADGIEGGENSTIDIVTGKMIKGVPDILLVRTKRMRITAK